MEFRSIEIKLRDSLGSSASRNLRKEDYLPCVVYGREQEHARHGSISVHHLETELRTGKFSNQVYELHVGGEKIYAVVKEIQREPVFDRPIHIDFLQVTEGQKVPVQVMLRFINKEKSAVLKTGGTLSIMSMHLNLLCPLHGVPKEVAVDLERYQTAVTITAEDVPLPEGVERADRKNYLVAAIIPPKIKGAAKSATGEGKKS